MQNPKEAFNWIIDILENEGIEYKISGGLAVRAYGSERELVDIDIEVATDDLEKIFQKTKEFATYSPQLFTDENWKLYLLTLNYKGQDIDINGNIAEIFNKKSGEWEKYTGDLNDFNKIKIFDRVVNVDSVNSLIDYKSKLGREVDLQDIEFLKLM